MNWKPTNDLYETKCGCTLVCGEKEYQGVAHLFAFRRDDLRFWFGKLDIDAVLGDEIPEQAQVVLEDGTKGWASTSEDVALFTNEQHFYVTVVGLSKLVPEPNLTG